MVDVPLPHPPTEPQPRRACSQDEIEESTGRLSVAERC
jgi:hypothetical protein